MFEKVNPKHPDKIADRIAGAIVDIAYEKNYNPRIAVEVLIGHNLCTIIVETDTKIKKKEIQKEVYRILGSKIKIKYLVVEQDQHLSLNQTERLRCGDNGIFKGVKPSEEEINLTKLANVLYKKFDSDGKYITDGERLIICQSNATKKQIEQIVGKEAEINPLGEWTGGTNVDTGATNRKLGSDMGRSVTGGGLHGKDLSKADVTINIVAFQEAIRLGKPVEISCAIGDEKVGFNGREYDYQDLVERAREYIRSIGGFEKFAEWGLIRPTK